MSCGSLWRSEEGEETVSEDEAECEEKISETNAVIVLKVDYGDKLQRPEDVMLQMGINAQSAI